MPRIHVFSEDPDLLSALPSDARESVGRSLVDSIELEPGPWAPDVEDLGRRAPLGLLLLDGLIAHRLHFSGRRSIELLGQGDVLRPWAFERDDLSLRLGSSWRVHQPTRVALLDPSFGREISEWPQVHAALQDRLLMRTRSQALQLAITNLTGVDTRLLLTLWGLADRWGSVTPYGVVLRLPLTHDELADMVGARRPSVSTALSLLASRGLLTRRRDGWLLTGRPPVSRF